MYGLFISVRQEDGRMSFTLLSSLECILMMYGALVCFLSFQYQRERSQGMFAPVLRCSVFLSITGWCLYGLIFLKGHYSLYPSSLQKGIEMMRIGALCLVMEWVIAEKGHFWKHFTWSGMFIFVIYCTVALIAGAMGHGIGIGDHAYPYPFLDMDLLGWQIVIPNVILLLVELWAYDRIWIGIDRLLKRRVKKHDKEIRTGSV